MSMKRWIAIGILVVMVIGLLAWNLSGVINSPKNPDYNKLMAFLKTDHSETLNVSGYVSHAVYTRIFLDNAREQKIKGSYICVVLEARLLLFAGFETEKGWVYIFPANDREIKLEKGKSFRELNPQDDAFGPGNDTILAVLVLR